MFKVNLENKDSIYSPKLEKKKKMVYKMTSLSRNQTRVW